MRAGLLDGPRGRRLCLALAAGVSEGVRAAYADAACVLHPGSGRSRVILWGSDGGGPTTPKPMADLDRLAAEIDAADPGPIDVAAVERTLPGVVDAATYWQDPDGDPGRTLKLREPDD